MSPLVPVDRVYLLNDLVLRPGELTLETTFEIEDRGLYDSLVRHEFRATIGWSAPIYESDPFDETIYLHSWADVKRLWAQIVAGVGYEYRKARGRPRIVGKTNGSAFGVLTDISS